MSDSFPCQITDRSMTPKTGTVRGWYEYTGHCQKELLAVAAMTVCDYHWLLHFSTGSKWNHHKLGRIFSKPTKAYNKRAAFLSAARVKGHVMNAVTLLDLPYSPKKNFSFLFKICFWNKSVGQQAVKNWSYKVVKNWHVRVFFCIKIQTNLAALVQQQIAFFLRRDRILT